MHKQEHEQETKHKPNLVDKVIGAIGIFLIWDFTLTVILRLLDWGNDFDFIGVFNLVALLALVFLGVLALVAAAAFAIALIADFVGFIDLDDDELEESKE